MLLYKVQKEILDTKLGEQEGGGGGIASSEKRFDCFCQSNSFKMRKRFV